MVTSNQEWVHIYTADDERLISLQVVGGEKHRWTLRGLDNRVLREYVCDRATSTGVIERDNIYRGSGPSACRSDPSRRSPLPRRPPRHPAPDHRRHGRPGRLPHLLPLRRRGHRAPPRTPSAYKFTGHERDLGDPARGRIWDSRELAQRATDRPARTSGRCGAAGRAPASSRSAAAVRGWAGPSWAR